MDLFRRETPKVQLRKSQRDLKSATRDLERDRLQCERQARELEIKIKKAVRSNDQTLVKQLAKQLIKLRQTTNRNVATSVMIAGIGHRQTAMNSQIAISNAISTGTKAIAGGSNAMKTDEMHKTLIQFQQQAFHLDTSEEIMNETLDSLLQESDVEVEEGQGILDQILDEIGIDVGKSMASVPKSTLPQDNIHDDILKEKLVKLKSI